MNLTFKVVQKEIYFISKGQLINRKGVIVQSSSSLHYGCSKHTFGAAWAQFLVHFSLFPKDIKAIIKFGLIYMPLQNFACP